VPNAKSVLDLVIGMLNDQSSNLKRDAALKTLGQIVSNTGEVIAPYIEHPNLLGILFRFLRTETSQVIRLETIRTMGMLGALDPFKHKVSKRRGGEKVRQC
jgi:FKBP12-rapamycin complex-associated protein